MNNNFNIGQFFDPDGSKDQRAPLCGAKPDRSRPKMRKLMGIAATVLLWMVACLTPQTVYAADAATLATLISSTTGATATAVGSVVTVTGTTPNTPWTLTLDINADVTVDWKATASGSSAPIYLTGGGEFILSDGSIPNGISSNGVNAKITISGGSVSSASSYAIVAYGANNEITVSGGTVSTTLGPAIVVGGVNSTVTVTGGTISAPDMTVETGGRGIYTYAANTTIIVTGGNVSGGLNAIGVVSANSLVFFKNGTLTGGGLVAFNFDSPGDSFYILWDGTEMNFAGGPGLTAASNEGTPTASWAISGGKSGVNYGLGSNTGFLETPWTTVFEASYTVTVSPALSNGNAINITNVTTSTPVNPNPTATVNSIATLSFKAVPAFGYEFVEWTGDLDGTTDEITDFLLTKNITLSATFREISFTVTFDYNDGVTPSNPVVVLKDQPVGKPTDPTRDGFTFLGWFNGGSEFNFTTPITANITLTAQWSGIFYEVTFDADNGTVNATETVGYNGKATEPEEPEKEGFTFLGWFTDEDELWDFDDTVTDDMTLTAQWKAITYEVIFDADNGTENDTETVGYGEKVDEPEEPEKEGFIFLGWFTDEDVLWDFDDIVTEDMTLTAQWEAITFEVTFDADNGTEIVTETVGYGEKANEPEEPEKEGFIFLGWYTDEGELWDFNDPVMDDMTLTADWVDDATAVFTVTFDYNDGGETGNSERKVLNGETVTKPGYDPYREGYEFLYWADSNGEEFDFSTPITKSITLTAQWEEIKPTEYIVTFDYNDGETEEEEVTVEAGNKVEQPETPTRDGYEFLCWVLGVNIFDFNTPINDNITLTAKWKNMDDPETFTVTFDFDDEETDSEEVEVEEGYLVDEPEDPAREGYEFLGWFIDNTKFNFDTPVTEDFTLTAKWKAEALVMYEVTFVFENGDDNLVVEVQDGETVNRPTDPVKTNYEFDGWYMSSSAFDFATPITEDITLTAKWTKVTSAEDIFAPNLNIYPNPFADVVRIKGAEGTVLKVITVNGITVHTQKIENTEETIHLGTLPKGLYIFRIESGKMMKSLKAVKD